MGNKGFATSIIVLSLLTLFFVTFLILITTISNSTSLNNSIKKNIVEEIEYEESSSSNLEDRILNLEAKLDSIKDEIYPIGSIYMSIDDNTTELVSKRFGGKWEKIQDSFLIGASSNYKVNTTGGNAFHKHESPVNSLNNEFIGVTTKFGTTNNNEGNFYSSSVNHSENGGTYTSYYTSLESNIPPYTAVYIYKRIE